MVASSVYEIKLFYHYSYLGSSRRVKESHVENYVFECACSYKQYDGEDGFRTRKVVAETCINICVQFYYQQIAQHISLLNIRRTLCHHVAATCSHFVNIVPFYHQRYTILLRTLLNKTPLFSCSMCQILLGRLQ